MAPWTAIAIYFLFSTLLALFIGSDAQRKGLRKQEIYGWTAITIIFSLIALILYLIVIAPKPKIPASCLKCGKPIQLDWEFCPYCGYKREKT